MDRYDYYTDRFVKDVKSKTTVYSNKTLAIKADNKLDEPVVLTGMCEKLCRKEKNYG